MNFKTVLPIGLRPKYTDERNEIGHLEIDSIVGKRNESHTIISIVDRCSRQVHLLKAEYTFDYYTSSLITKYLKTNDIEVKSITVDNGFEFKTMGICAKTFGVKLYKCDLYCSFQRGTNEHMNGIEEGSFLKVNHCTIMNSSIWKIFRSKLTQYHGECLTSKPHLRYTFFIYEMVRLRFE